MTALLYLIQIYRVIDRCKGSGLRVQGSGFRVQGSGFRVVAAASPQIVMGRSAPVLLTFPSRGRLCVEDSVVLVSQPSPSNLRPFGAPPSIGRRECPRKPLPLEGAAERSEAGLALFFWRRSRLLFAFPTQERLCFGDSGILVS